MIKFRYYVNLGRWYVYRDDERIGTINKNRKTGTTVIASMRRSGLDIGGLIVPSVRGFKNVDDAKAAILTAARKENPDG